MVAHSATLRNRRIRSFYDQLAERGKTYRGRHWLPRAKLSAIMSTRKNGTHWKPRYCIFSLGLDNQHRCEAELDRPHFEMEVPNDESPQREGR